MKKYPLVFWHERAEQGEQHQQHVEAFFQKVGLHVAETANFPASYAEGGEHVEGVFVMAALEVRPRT